MPIPTDNIALEIPTITGAVSAWCLSPAKRLFDLCCAIPILIVCSPALLLVAIMVRLSSPGPALFRQQRLGKDGRPFTLFKFRSMTHNPTWVGPGLTRKNDPRVTTLGRVLRKWKLDELPQFINVALGDMSLVGPRPDLAEFWATLSPEQQRNLCLRPGVTGRATLQFPDEEAILAKVPKDHLADYYVSWVFPEKIRLDWEYAKSASLYTDCKLLLHTLGAIRRTRLKRDSNLNLISQPSTTELTSGGKAYVGKDT